jgi:hypothetical protein
MSLIPDFENKDEALDWCTYITKDLSLILEAYITRNKLCHITLIT